MMDTYMDIRMCDWLKGEIYFYNFPTSKKFKEALKRDKDTVSF